jgi:hypothetical protein
MIDMQEDETTWHQWASFSLEPSNVAPG